MTFNRLLFRPFAWLGRSLRWRSAASMAVLGLGVGVVGAVGLVMGSSHVVDGFGLRLAERQVVWRREQLNSVIGPEVALLRSMATSPLVVDWARDSDHDPALRAAALAEMERYRGLLKSKKPVAIIAKNGHYYASAPEEGVDRLVMMSWYYEPAPGREWFYELMDVFTAADPPPHVITLSPQMPHNILKLWISLPIRAGDQVVGAVGSGYDIAVLRASREPDAPTIETLLIDDKGVVGLWLEAASSDEGAAKPVGAPLGDLMADEASRDGLRAAWDSPLTADGAATASVRTRNGPRLAALTRLQPTEWRLAALVDPNMEITSRLYSKLGGLAVLIFVAVIGAAMLNQDYMVIRPLRRLARAAARIGAGDYAVRVHHQARDEIGVLGDTFNDMAEQVQAHTHNLQDEVRKRTKDAESALLAANDALSREQAALRQYKQFVSLISHEFRNPLGIIKSNAQLLDLETSRNKTPTGLSSRAIGSIERAGDRLELMFEQWICSEDILEGRIPFRAERLRLADLLRDLAPHAANIHDHRVTLHEPPAGATVDGDAVMLRVALLNLIDNAVKYCPPGCAIDVSAWREGARVVLQVRDDGPGIAAEHIGRLFDKFYRGVSEGDRRGLGIGLYLVQRICQAHGGEATIESEPGKGTLCKMTIPSEAAAL